MPRPPPTLHDPLLPIPLPLSVDRLPPEAAVPPSIWPTEVLLWAAPLLLLGAILGGLRVLLSSPLRSSLLQSLPEAPANRLEACEPHWHRLATTAGLLRLACVVAAVTLLVQGTEPLDPWNRWPVWAGAALFAGLVLEGIPSLVVRQRGVRLVLAFLPVVRLLAWPLRPFTALVEATMRLLGADPSVDPTATLAADLIQVAQDHDREEELDDLERRMISHVIELPETDAAEVMTPRTELCAVSAPTPVAEALRVSQEEGHSRVLVYEEDIDHVLGVFYVKDVLLPIASGSDAAQEPVKDHCREPYFVPETMKVPSLMDEMRRRRVHLAVVVDEYGGTAGVVTIEDLLEEIVGEIEDEHDPEDESLYFERLDADQLVVDGRYSVADLNEVFGCALPEDKDYDTLAGMLFDRLGHIPEEGETIQLDGVTLKVVEADDRRIHRVRVQRIGIPKSDAA